MTPAVYFTFFDDFSIFPSVFLVVVVPAAVDVLSQSVLFELAV